MVYMKNIKKNGSKVSFDGYINGKEENHFSMTVDLNNSSRSTISIEKNHYTSMAMLKIYHVFAENGSLPKELVAMTH